MSNFYLTLVIAFVIIVLALACLAIGWLVTGKSKLQRGACGKDPTQKKTDDCDSICHLCSNSVKTDPDKEIQEDLDTKSIKDEKTSSEYKKMDL